jgi:hypothetical protein
MAKPCTSGYSHGSWPSKALSIVQRHPDTPFQRKAMFRLHRNIHTSKVSYTKWKMTDQSDTISVSSRSQYSLFSQSRLQLIASLHGSDVQGSSRSCTRRNHSSRQYAPERVYAVSSLRSQYEELTSGRSMVAHEHIVYLSRGAPRIVSCRARSRLSWNSPLSCINLTNSSAIAFFLQ